MATAMDCHWSMERMRWEGFCTSAPSITPGSKRSGRATSSNGESWICGWEVSTRLMKLV